MTAGLHAPSALRAPRRRHQRGLSLVEMLVGVAIGLFIVAAATMLVASQLSDNRRLLLDTQIQQDLRATADIITRDLRRAGFSDDTITSLWNSAVPDVQPSPNSFSALDVSTPGQVLYRYNRQSERLFGLKLDNHTIYRRINATAWQPLTDSNSLKITTFTVTQVPVATLKMACQQLCAGNSQSCWPTVDVRELLVTIRGESTTDASVQREITSRVRLRNDNLNFNANAGTQVCP